MMLSKPLIMLVLLLPTIVQAQFGPKKRDLQLRLDTLELINNLQGIELQNQRQRDSINSAELKRIANEMRDLKKLMIELNGDIRQLKLENERLNIENIELTKRVDKHEMLIKNVIGGDSNEIEEIAESIDETVQIGKAERVQNFEEFAYEFISTIKKTGELGLKNYLREQKTFYYLSKPGFITSVTEISDINELTEEIPWRAALDAFVKSKFSLLEGEKPEVNCEMSNFYNKLGCYGGIEQNFNKVSNSLIALKEFSPEDESKLNSQIDEIKSAEKSVMAFIFSTDGNLGFYFIKKDDSWKLYCLEVEDPCSA